MCLSPSPSWPAVICKDPEGDWELVETDEDKDKIHMYHVIFLGKTKSRAWVPDDKVRVDVCAVGVCATMCVLWVWVCPCVCSGCGCVRVCALGVGVSMCVLWVWVCPCVFCRYECVHVCTLGVGVSMCVLLVWVGFV